MLGLATVAGVGFTVALFVTSLSFDDPAITDSAKIGILAGSVLAGATGYAILRSCRPESSVLPDATPASTVTTVRVEPKDLALT